MVGGVCILILLGTIHHSLSAPEPVDTVNINLNLGEGTNTGQSHDYIHDYSQSHGNGAGPPHHDEKAYAPSYENGIYPSSYGYVPYQPVQFQDTILGGMAGVGAGAGAGVGAGVGAGIGAGLGAGIGVGVEPYPGAGTLIPRIKIDDAYHDTSNIRICKDESVRECVRIIVNVNDIMSAKKLILPNGDIIRDGKTLNLYGNSDHSDYRWREKPNLFQLKNPRLYKTTNNFEVMFSETDGVIAAHIPSINNIEYTIEYCGGGCYLWIKRDTSVWVDDVEIPRRNPGWKNRYNRRGIKATSGGWQHSMFEDYQDTSSTLSIDDDPVRVSVMVYYTKQYATAARDDSSDESAFDLQRAITELAFNQANHGLRESQIPIQYYPHCFSETTIRERQTTSETLKDVENLGSSRREIRKSADIAVVLLEKLDAGECGEVANVGVVFDSDPATFAVIKRNCIISKYTFSHELAHLFGARHNIEESEFPPLYAHGILFLGRFSTVLSYKSKRFKNETRINRFSSPNLNYEGTVIGNSSYANNARLLRETGRAMSNIGKEDLACPAAVHVCLTINTGLTCQFPFIYNGIENNECINDGVTEPWCSTNVTSTRIHMAGNWDYCRPDCLPASPALLTRLHDQD